MGTPIPLGEIWQVVVLKVREEGRASVAGDVGVIEQLEIVPPVLVTLIAGALAVTK
jgi:hypothetical protein